MKPTTYTVLTKLSRVTFSFEHQECIPISGSLHMAPDIFVFDEANWANSSIDVTLSTLSLDMGNALWNRQIRGDEAWAALFNRPGIKFRSTQLRRLDRHHAMLSGELTLAGVIKPMVLRLTVNKIGKNSVSDRPSVGFSATTTIKLSDFGMNAYSDLVGDDVTVQVELEGFTGPEPEDQTDLSAKGLLEDSAPKK